MIAPQIKPRKSTEIRVYLVEDQALLRQTLRAMLELEGGISVVGESETADHAIHAIDAKDVDLVVMDLQMPGMTGIEATRVLQEKHEELPVLILTAFDQEYFEVAMEAGVTGYVSKSCTPAQLIQAIQAAYLGHALIDPALAGRLVRGPGQPSSGTGGKFDRPLH